MESLYNRYIKLLTDSGGVYFPGIIQDETKSKYILTPIFETFTNALEAIKLKNSLKNYEQGNKINVCLNYSSDDVATKLISITIEDTGIGFNYNSFKSFCTYKYNKKGFQNKGCGRFQCLLFFANTAIKSKFIEDNKKYEIVFDFNNKNVNTKGINIISFQEAEDSSEEVGTLVELIPEAEDTEFNALDFEILKRELIKKYALEFLLFDVIPEINICKNANNA